MTIKEISDEFDVMLNNSGTNAVLDEYEKSVLLTKAQEEVVRELYKSVFEQSEYGRETLKTLIKIAKYDHLEVLLKNKRYIAEIDIPKDIMYIISEQAFINNKCNDIAVSVLPITHDELSDIVDNPFRGTTERRVLRLDINSGVKLISNYNIEAYSITYLKIPAPIILVTLPDGLSINNQVTESKSIEVPEHLHRLILNLAVQYALQKYSNKSAS